MVMLADALQEQVRPEGLALVMQASHMCMHWRGVKDDGALMGNSIMRGAFLTNASLRQEFLSLSSRQGQH